MAEQRSAMVTITKEELERRKAKYDRVIKTICPMCPTGCGVEVMIKNEKIEEIVPNYEHPMGLLCPKGEAAIEWEYSPDRCLYPEKREGREWKRLSWDEALDFAAKEMNKIKEKYGPESLAVHMGNPFIDSSLDILCRLFCRAYGTPNFATGASYCNSAQVMANRLTMGYVSMPSYKGSKYIIVWGCNPAHSSIAQLEAIQNARAEGAKVIVIDPRTSDTVKAGVDLHIKIRPGTDAALALALIKVILDEDLYDKKFVTEWSLGFDKLPEAVKEYTPERAEEITWIPVKIIREIARAFSSNRPACILQGIAPQHAVNAVDANRAMVILLGITGNIDVPGGNIYTIKQNYKLRDFHVQPSPYSSHPKTIGLKDHPLFTDMYGENSNSLVFNQMLTGEPYPVKGLMVVGSNIMRVWPNTNKLTKALKNLDFMMVIDVMKSSTTEMADLVLPAATLFEKDDIKNIADFAGIPMLNRAYKAVEPLGESWPEFKIFAELGKRMGYKTVFHWDTFEELFRELTESMEIDFRDVMEMPRGAFYGTKVNVKKYRKDGFNTPSKKFEIYSNTLEKYGYNPILSYREPIESPISQPGLAKEYPLTLITGPRSLYFTHGQHRNIPSLRAKCPENLLEINPVDSERFDIKDGEKVIVETLRGGVRIKAKVTEDIIPGVVEMMHGWDDPNANILTNDEARDHISGFTEFRVNLCRVKKIS